MTCRRAISETYHVGMADESANGSSKCAIRSSRIDRPSGRHDELVVLGAEMPRHRARVLELVERGVVEADRERLHRPRRGAAPSCRRPRRNRRRRRGTRRAARRSSCASDTASRSTAAQRLDRLFLGSGERFLAPRSASSARLRAAVAPAQEVPRRQLADALEDRRVARRVEERQVVIERREIECRVDRAGREQRLDLAAEVAAGRRVRRSAAASDRRDRARAAAFALAGPRARCRTCRAGGGRRPRPTARRRGRSTRCRSTCRSGARDSRVPRAARDSCRSRR